MKFQLYRSLNYEPDAKKMLEKYPALKDYNFKQDKSGRCYVIISSVKQLIQFVKDINQEIILSPNNSGIEIYDYYREQGGLKMTLNLPSFEYLKSITGVDEEITVFQVIEGVYGQITVNEDGENCFCFDLMVNGYSGENEWTRFFHSNKKGYEALKIHAQNCYQLILNNLVNQTHYWQDEQRSFELRKAVDNIKSCR